MSKTDYQVRTVEMVLACSTIAMNAIENKVALQAERSTWQDPFFENFQLEIENAIQSYLGMDSSKNLKLATLQVLDIASDALTFLTRFKKQVEQDFKDQPERRDFIMSTLGFSQEYKIASKNEDQEALINLLFTFKENLTAELQTEIVEKGISPTLIANIISKASALKNSNVVQEFYKGTRKVLTAEAIDTFNEIYKKAISICVISRDLFKGDRERQDLFSFNKVAKNMNRLNINLPA